MYKLLFVVVLLSFLSLALSQTAITKFTASFLGVELDPTTKNTIRTFSGTFYYENDWVASTSATGVVTPAGGHQAMRYDISLNDGTTTQTLTEIDIFEDQFFEYTICGGRCAWQDIYAQEPLPQMYISNGLTKTGTATIDGVSCNQYVISQTNIIGYSYPSFVTLYTRSDNNDPVRVLINYSTVIRQLDFTGVTTTFDSSVFNVPAGCPIINAGCFRVDLSIVQDVSGSVGNQQVITALDFIVELTNNFLVDAQHVALGHVSFADCYSISVNQKMTYVKQTYLTAMQNLINLPLQSAGWTCLSGASMVGLWNTNISQGGRPATRKAMLVITDGNGNRPCGTNFLVNNPTQTKNNPGGIDINCNSWNTALFNQNPQCCFTCPSQQSPCDGGVCCQTVHDWQLGIMYTQFYAQYNPTIYAVGVGQDISDATLKLIVNDPAAIILGQARIFRVNSWQQVNSAFAALAASILCNVAGSQTCPNDCRPGGFCCAGSCLCSTDCSLLSTECQQSTCLANAAGAQCSLGAPENSSCNDPRIQCQNRYCLANTGCTGIADDSKNCSDGNACTFDVCINGLCNSTLNPAVANCDDHNPCTKNDHCTPNGQCVGTPDDNLVCTDGNGCTKDTCINATCVSVVSVTCPDLDTTDCLVPQCVPATGNCTEMPVDAGFVCAPAPQGDNCTVYICYGFSAQDYANCILADPTGDSCNDGSCIKKLKSGCGSSSINTAGIIGGVVAGVAFLAILGICLAILLLFLCRKHVPILRGLFNPFEGNNKVHDAKTYEHHAGGGQNDLYTPS